jgi:hypothetical protein
MAQNPSPPPLPGTSRPLRKLNPSPSGVGIGAEYMNSIIGRIEELILIAEAQKPVAGNNIQINFTDKGAVINAVTQ